MANNPFQFRTVRHQYRTLCDIPPCDRTAEQTEQHKTLGRTIGRFEMLVPVMEALKARTNGKIVPVALESEDDPSRFDAVHVHLGSTGVVIQRIENQTALDALRAMLLGVEIARS